MTMTSRSRRLLALLFVALAGGVAACSTYAVPRYAASTDNLTALKKLNMQPITVGEFKAKDHETSSLGCRAVGPIKTPDGEPYSQYVRKALIAELKTADVYAESGPVTLTGTLEHADFSSTGGAWEIAMTVASSNGKSMHVDESYSYSSSFFGETACNQSAQAFMPAVQDLIGKMVRDPEFKALVGASDAAASASASVPPAASSAAPAAKTTSSNKRKR